MCNDDGARTTQRAAKGLSAQISVNLSAESPYFLTVLPTVGFDPTYARDILRLKDLLGPVTRVKKKKKKYL